MPVQTTIHVSLTPDLDRFVSDRVASGRYQSASEVVVEGLRLLERQEHDREEALAEVRKKIKVGLEQAKRGEVVDGHEVFKKLEERSKRRRASSWEKTG